MKRLASSDGLKVIDQIVWSVASGLVLPSHQMLIYFVNVACQKGICKAWRSYLWNIGIHLIQMNNATKVDTLVRAVGLVVDMDGQD